MCKGLVSGDKPLESPTDVRICVPGMPHLSKKISHSVASFEDGSSTTNSNLEVDMSTYERRSKEYFYQKSVKTATAAKDANGNEDEVTNVAYTDPLPFWVNEVVNY